MSQSALTNISPVDGRYIKKTESLSPYFSEFALIKYRVYVEIEYLIALAEKGLPQLRIINDDIKQALRSIATSFSIEDAATIKATEKVTNHDVKAVEYFVKEKLESLGLTSIIEFVHFGLTSQDINNTSMPLMLKDGLTNIMIPQLSSVLEGIRTLAIEYADVTMLAKTHGQPASPTSLGKEFMVFVERLETQLDLLRRLPHKAKFGGATGNFNAHVVSFPEIDWRSFGNDFLSKIGLERSQYTTQIAHYDNMGAIFDALARLNTILVDFCRDIWTYISMEYFKQKTIANEVGSSAMPHKVNPIDFENAEGNLLLANATLSFLTEKLPVSRLQRDLTDSTVSRNIGVPLAHVLIAYTSIKKGLSKLQLNPSAIQQDLDDNWVVIAEAIQNILRREGIEKPYEKLKALTRGKQTIGKQEIHEFIHTLDVSESVKQELLLISPNNYRGYTI